MNASELKEDARKRAIQVAMPASFYLFNEKQLESYKEQLCKEQREICANEAVMKVSDRDKFHYEIKRDSIRNAPEPE